MHCHILEYIRVQCHTFKYIGLCSYIGICWNTSAYVGTLVYVGKHWHMFAYTGIRWHDQHIPAYFVDKALCKKEFCVKAYIVQIESA